LYLYSVNLKKKKEKLEWYGIKKKGRNLVEQLKQLLSGCRGGAGSFHGGHPVPVR